MPDRTRRQLTIAAAAGGALAVGALMAYARWRRVPPPPTFANGMPYRRFGSGPRPLLVMWGGPGNDLPSGLVPFLKHNWKPLLKDYTVYVVSRRSGLPLGYTTRQMADDLAETIRQEFQPPVDVMGISFGGMIVQHLGADHGELVRRLVIAMAAHTLSDRGRTLDSMYSRHASRGEWGAAYAVSASGPAQRALRHVVGSLSRPAVSPTFAQDVAVELVADLQHDALDRLGAIRVPTLVICGADDPYFSEDLVRRTAAAIPDARLILYPGQGHDIIVSRRFGADVHAFLSQSTP